MIDWTKPVETDEENPRPVRVLATDRPYESAPIVCMRDDGVVFSVSLTGCTPAYPNIRVRNVRPKPVKREGWVGLYHLGTGLPGCTHVCETEDKAARGLPSEVLIGTLRIEWGELP